MTAPVQQRLSDVFGLAPRTAWKRQLPKAISELAKDLAVEPRALERRLLVDRGTLGLLVSFLVVSESFFFRHEDQNPYLLEHLRELSRERQRAVVWSAGCARGEEAYSVGLLLTDAFGPEVRCWVDLLGTDLSAPAIARARTGEFGSWSWRRGSQHRQHVTFRPDGSFRIADWLRDWIRFDTALVADRARTMPEDHVDIILFRNVGIYQTRAALAETHYALLRVLKPGGLLFIAPSDPTPSGFELVPEAAIYRKPCVTANTLPEESPRVTGGMPVATARRSEHGSGSVGGAVPADIRQPDRCSSTPPPLPRPEGEPSSTLEDARGQLARCLHRASGAELRLASALSPEDPLLRYWHAVALVRSGMSRRARLQLSALLELLATRGADDVLGDQETRVHQLRTAAWRLWRETG